MEKLDVTYLIDDDQIFTYLLSKQMKMIDFCDTIMVFNDGDEALGFLKAHADTPINLPSVILLDINMPVMDGWQFLDEFAKFDLQKRVTIYIVSSSIDDADRAKAASYKEVANFYVKPISKDDLIAILSNTHKS